MEQRISEFRGETRWLSNFADGSVAMPDGNTYFCREGAYQAYKLRDPKERKQFENLSGKDAKALGMKVPLRSDWEEIKDDVMYDVCLAFFKQHINMCNRLIATEGIHLEEGNTWHDNHFGTCTCPKCGNHGLNMLGRILMKIRAELQEGAYA